MPIDTEEEYDPRLMHPLYCKIIPDNHNDYQLWEEYEVRIPDDDAGEDGPYNYVFEAVLVGKFNERWESIHPLLKAYTARTRDAQDAHDIIHPLGEDGSYSADDELTVLFFLRTDETKEFITMDSDVLIGQMTELMETEGDEQ